MFAGLVAGCAERPAGEAAYPRVYEYTYEHNTPTLNENHYIVLDSTGGSIRGWYFGTSDDFDSAREGYLPGFFVAEMEDLRVARDTISFTLRPRKLFASPVPLHYRDAAVIPADSLPEWTGPPLASMKSYSGTATSDRISLEMGTGERLFQRVTRRM